MSSPGAGPSSIPMYREPARKKRCPTTYMDASSSSPSPSSKSPSLSSLPPDILLIIIGLIEIEDILALRRTSKRFMSVTKLRWVWSDALVRQVIDRKIPVPSPVADFKSLSSQQLEARALHATTFHRNWTSSSPRPRRVFEWSAGPGANEADKVSHVRFLPGHDGRLVLSVQRSRVVCWEVPLTGEDAFVVAERCIPDASVVDIMVNEDPTNDAAFVLVWATHFPLESPETFDRPRSTRNSTIEAWALDRFYGTFTTLRSDTVPEHVQERILPLNSLVGDVALVGDPTGVWNWTRPGKYTMLNLAAGHNSPAADKLLAVRVVRDYLIVVRQYHIQFLPMVSFAPDGQPVTPRGDFGAVAVHLRELSTEAKIIVHPLPPSERAKWLFDPVTILLRCTQDSGLHIVRTYAVLPQPASTLPASASASASGSHAHAHAHAHGHANAKREPDGCAGCTRVAAQLPFAPPAGPVHTYVVPPSCGRLVVGQHGRGLWLETRNVRAPRGRETHAARAFVRFDAVARRVGNGNGDGDGNEDGYIGDADGLVGDGHEGGWRSVLEVYDRPLHAARAGVNEVSLKSYRIVDVALEDTVGRVAVGCRDGRIQVMDFA